MDLLHPILPTHPLKHTRILKDGETLTYRNKLTDQHYYTFLSKRSNEVQAMSVHQLFIDRSSTGVNNKATSVTTRALL